MKKYTVSVIANVTINLVIECEDEEKAKEIVDGMDYAQLIDEGIISIYSANEIEIDQDIEEFDEKHFEPIGVVKKQAA